MSEVSFDLLGVRTFGDHQRGGCMAEIVNAEPIWCSSSLESGLPHILGEVGVPQGSTIGGGEHETAGIRVRLTDEVVVEDVA